jgi:hypothetical protein
VATSWCRDTIRLAPFVFQAFRLSMIWSENQSPLCGIMLYCPALDVDRR